MVASLARWRMSGSKPPSSRHVRCVISSHPIAGWPPPTARRELRQWHRARVSPGGRVARRQDDVDPVAEQLLALDGGRRRRGPCCHSSPITRSIRRSPAPESNPQARPRRARSAAARVARQRLHRRDRQPLQHRLEARDARAASDFAGDGGEVGIRFAARSSSASACSTSVNAASVRRTPRPARSSSRTPVSRSSSASCWETAEGVNCSASATAAIVPRSCSSHNPQPAEVEHPLGHYRFCIRNEYCSRRVVSTACRSMKTSGTLFFRIASGAAAFFRRDGGVRESRLRHRRDGRDAARRPLHARRRDLLGARAPLPEIRAVRCPRDRSRRPRASAPCGYALQAGCYFVALGAHRRLAARAAPPWTFPALVAAAAVALGRERLSAAATRSPSSLAIGRARAGRWPARARARSTRSGRRARARRRGRLQRLHPRLATASPARVRAARRWRRSSARARRAR